MYTRFTEAILYGLLERLAIPGLECVYNWSITQPQRMALEVGSRLGHYEVTALIGEGGMGQVYQATDTKLSLEGVCHA